MCGWTKSNHDLRCELIKHLCCDIVSINETHLIDQSDINLSHYDYKWIAFNRSHIHINAPKGSGGVGLLVKNWLYRTYNVDIIDKSFEGILGVQFHDKENDFTLVVYSVYLPPENSPRGRDASTFFSHLLTQLYSHHDADAVIICGDFNARIGNTNDANDCIDNIPNRGSMDNIQNQHGKSFLEFLNDSRCCVLNGRTGEHSNRYTSLSPRGHSIVDYVCVPHDIYTKCKKFRIVYCNELVEQFNLTNLLGEKSKIPDHAAVMFDLNVQSYVPLPEETMENTKKRFNLRRIPPNFMNSENVRNAICDLITKIETCREVQKQVNDITMNFVN